MKTDVFKLTSETADLERMLDETEKAASYSELDKKQTIRLRLLAEELIGMVPELLQFCSGEFWVESEGKKFELHVSVELDDITSADRDQLLAVSTSGKNAAAKGIMGKVRAAVEMMFVDYLNSTVDLPDDFYSMGIVRDPFYYTNSWTLHQYKANAKGNEEAWDELEKSIIAAVADDVVVGIIGRKVDIIVKKDMSKGNTDSM